MISATEELDRFLARKASLFAQALLNVVVMSKKGPYPEREALEDLARLIGHTMILADLHGRKRALMEVDAAKRRGASFTGLPDTTPIVPGVEFDEAVDRLLDVEPRLAASAQEVSRLYNAERVFAMARSASLKVTERVQHETAKLISEGKSWGEVENAILDIGRSAAMGDVRDWTRAYAATVYQTNANTAYSTGRFQQAMDPDVQEVMPAVELMGIRDAQTRPNHAAAHGLVAAARDPIWRRFSAPLGFNCRCGVRLVSKYELARRGLIQGGSVTPYYPPNFAAAYPDPGFGTRTIDFALSA